MPIAEPPGIEQRDDGGVPTDDERHRVELLAALYAAVDRRAGTAVDAAAVGREVGLNEAEVAVAHRWLLDNGLVADLGLGRQRVALTEAGVARASGALEDPGKGSAGLPPASTTTVNIETLIQAAGDVTQVRQRDKSRASVGGGSRSASGEGLGGEPNWWVKWVLGIVATVVAGSALAYTTGLIGGDEPPKPVQCAAGPCWALTVRNDDGIGVYVRSDPTGAAGTAGRRTGVFAGLLVYGVCVEDNGLNVDGNTQWVKTPFDFVDGDIDPQTGAFPRAVKSQPSRSSSDYGWITAESLGPADALDELPDC